MLVSRGEIYTAVVYKREKNAMGEYSEVPNFSFKCKIASKEEEGTFQPTSGLLTNNHSILLYATRLDKELSLKDKVVFLGKEYLVEEIGIYINKNRYVSGDIFSDKKIINDSPKGIRLS